MINFQKGTYKIIEPVVATLHQSAPSGFTIAVTFHLIFKALSSLLAFYRCHLESIEIQ